jgi:hypothetical protein
VTFAQTITKKNKLRGFGLSECEDQFKQLHHHNVFSLSARRYWFAVWEQVGGVVNLSA